MVLSIGKSLRKYELLSIQEKYEMINLVVDGPPHRLWMYKHTGEVWDDFINGVEEFDNFACSQ